MRMAAVIWMVMVLACLGALVNSAPIEKNSAATPNSVEVHEEGLIILVPTLPDPETLAAGGDKDGQALKREVEYEIITIPKEILRREIRQVAQLYNTPSQSSNNGQTYDPNTFIIGDGSHEDDNLIFTSTGSGSGTVPDFGQISGLVGGIGQTLTSVGQGAHTILGSVVPAAAAGGANAARWIANNKADSIRNAAELAGDGLRYAGKLSTSVLRVLLQVPAIKARVLSEVIRASQPLTYAISDVLAESADDFGDFFEAKNEILRDVMEIFLRLVQDALKLNGRIIAKLGASGLDIGATAFNAGVRVGGAFIETAGGVATALGSGFGDLIRVGTTADFPPPPQLPAINLLNLFPAFDLTRLFTPYSDSTPSHETLAPLPLPSNPPASPAPVQNYEYNQPSSQSFNIGRR